MEPDFLIELFAEFGPVAIRRMFSGFGIAADGIHFALALRGAIYLRADDQTVAKFEAEGSRPFQYQTRAREVTVRSYWQLPERLYDDPREFSEWAKAALAAAHRAAIRPCATPRKPAHRPEKVAKMPAARNTSAAARGKTRRGPPQSP
jgi:DNA transformation protein